MSPLQKNHMKLIFLGTPEFAVPILQKLLEAGKEIVAVITQPDKPAGRGSLLKSPPVKDIAEQKGLQCLQFKSLKKEDACDCIKQIMPDLGVVAAYGKIIPADVLKIPKFGFINVHPSLLPKYRGASPIQTAIINGEQETGVTIMQLDEGMDTGDILLQRTVEIKNDDTAETMHDRLSLVSAEMVIDAIKLLEEGKLSPVKQDHSKATYTKPLKKSNGEIEWKKSAFEIFNFVRGVYSWPGAYTFIHGNYLKVFPFKGYKNEATERNEAGMIVNINNESLQIQCGKGIVELTEVQLEGRKKLKVSEFLRGYKIEKGEILGKK